MCDSTNSWERLKADLNRFTLENPGSLSELEAPESGFDNGPAKLQGKVSNLRSKSATTALPFSALGQLQVTKDGTLTNLENTWNANR